MHYSNSCLELCIIKQRAQCSFHQNIPAQALNITDITSYVSQINNLPNFAEYIPFLKVKSFSPTKEIALILWNLMVYYRLHKIPPVVFFLRHCNPSRPLPAIYFNIHCKVLVS